MKTTEFIRKIEELGLEWEYFSEDYRVITIYDKPHRYSIGKWWVKTHEDQMFYIDTSSFAFGFLDTQKELFELMTEYAKTPLEER